MLPPFAAIFPGQRALSTPFPTAINAFRVIAAPDIWRLLRIYFILVSISSDVSVCKPISKKKSLNFFLLWNELYLFPNQKPNQFLTIFLWYSYYGCLLEPYLIVIIKVGYIFFLIFIGNTCLSFLTSSLSSRLFISLAALNMDACEA